MNMRFEKPAAPTLAWSARPGRRAPQARVAPVARAVAALSFDIGEEGARGGRLGGEIAGQPLPRPVISTRLPLSRGGHRHVLLLGQGAERLARTPCRLALDGATVAGIDPDWLQSPLVDAGALVEGLTDEGRRRLLKMMLTTGASLFGTGRTAGYGAAIRRLLRLLAVPELAPASVCGLGAAGRLLSYRLPAGPAPALEALAALTGDRVTRIGSFAVRVEAHPRGAILHVCAPAAPREGLLVGLGATPLALGAAGEAEARPLAPWLARRAEPVRAWVQGLLEAAAPDPLAAALLREVGRLGAAPPALTLRRLSATERGVLLLAEVSDPDGLLSALRLEAGEASRDLALEGGPVGGFLDLGPVRPGALCRLKLVYRSGRAQTARVARLDAYDGAIPEGFAKLPVGTAAPALAAARLSLRRRDLAVSVEAIGAPPARPRLSLLAAAGAADLIRARAALLFAEPEAGRVDVIYHARAAERRAVLRALEGCHAVFGLACRLVTLPDDANPAERLRAALGAARGASALALGAEVLPDGAGWLALWTRTLGGRRAPLILGGALLGPDGSVEDAGARLRVEGGAAWVERRWAGLPASALPPGPGPAELVGADCLGLNRAAIDAFCALDGGHPSPEVRLFGLMRGRRRRGGARVQGRFIRFREGCPPDPLREAADARAMAALRGLASERGA